MLRAGGDKVALSADAAQTGIRVLTATEGKDLEDDVEDARSGVMGKVASRQCLCGL